MMRLLRAIVASVILVCVCCHTNADTLLAPRVERPSFLVANYDQVSNTSLFGLYVSAYHTLDLPDRKVEEYLRSVISTRQYLVTVDICKNDGGQYDTLTRMLPLGDYFIVWLWPYGPHPCNMPPVSSPIWPSLDTSTVNRLRAYAVAAKGKTLLACIGVDFNEPMDTGKIYSSDELEALIVMAIGSGFKGIVWREASCPPRVRQLLGGLQKYRSELAAAEPVALVKADSDQPATALASQRYLFVFLASPYMTDPSLRVPDARVALAPPQVWCELRITPPSGMQLGRGISLLGSRISQPAIIGSNVVRTEYSGGGDILVFDLQPQAMVAEGATSTTKTESDADDVLAAIARLREVAGQAKARASVGDLDRAEAELDKIARIPSFLRTSKSSTISNDIKELKSARDQLWRGKLVDIWPMLALDGGESMVSGAADMDGNLLICTTSGRLLKYDCQRGIALEKRWTSVSSDCEELKGVRIRSIASAKGGRVWVGADDGTIAVYNGKSWEVHRLDAGELISLAVSSASRDVWAATAKGFYRFRETDGAWHELEIPMGSPATENISRIAVGGSGDLFVGTKSSGIYILRSRARYKWNTVVGAPAVPEEPIGSGLPSNIINDIVADGNKVYAATNLGLAFSNDNGDHWKFVRGRDYKDSLGLYEQYATKSEKHATYTGDLLLEDNVTSVAGDGAGNVWLGFRRAGFMALNAKGKPWFTHDRKGHNRTQGNEQGHNAITHIICRANGVPFIIMNEVGVLVPKVAYP